MGPSLNGRNRKIRPCSLYTAPTETTEGLKPHAYTLTAPRATGTMRMRVCPRAQGTFLWGITPVACRSVSRRQAQSRLGCPRFTEGNPVDQGQSGNRMGTQRLPSHPAFFHGSMAHSQKKQSDARCTLRQKAMCAVPDLTGLFLLFLHRELSGMTIGSQHTGLGVCANGGCGQSGGTGQGSSYG